MQKNSKWSNHILNILDNLYQRPIITASQVVEFTGVSIPTAYKIIDEMGRYGILKEITGGKRGQIFMFDPYIKLF